MIDREKFLTGEKIELPQMLDAREKRANVQRTLIEKYNLPVVSFTLNIAGPMKVFPLTVKTYNKGINLIKSYCRSHGLMIVHFEEIKEKTGYEGFFSIQAEALKIKRVLGDLEKNSSLGRLFDIDVIRTDGQKVSRTELDLEPRTCIICNRPAFECSRSRKHSVDEIIDREIEIMYDYFTMIHGKYISVTAVRAMLYEVNATPKPGLVDKDNSGSHDDMDVFTFEESALALMPYFTEFFLTGINNCELELEELFALIRPIGMKAEISMFQATEGINTHKGLIFSLGILCTALGYMYAKDMEFSEKKLQEIIMKMVAELEKDFIGISKETASTNGEKLFAEHGIKGIRGEALSGFSNVFDLALPKFKNLIKEGFSQNDAGILTLLYIIAYTEDTNIISRSDYNTMKEIQKSLRDYLEKEELNKQSSYREFIIDLDQDFISRNISPGGSADLLALTYFIFFYENKLLSI